MTSGRKKGNGRRSAKCAVLSPLNVPSIRHSIGNWHTVTADMTADQTDIHLTSDSRSP